MQHGARYIQVPNGARCLQRQNYQTCSYDLWYLVEHYLLLLRIWVSFEVDLMISHIGTKYVLVSVSIFTVTYNHVRIHSCQLYSYTYAHINKHSVPNGYQV